MVSSAAKTVAEYLRELTDDQRKVISAVRKVVNQNLPKGYEERMDWGMITWEVPLSVSGPTYNKKPLGVAALAAQKHYYSLYLPVYMDPAMEKAFRASYRKKLDMGKTCLRFKSVAELDLEAVAKMVASMPVERLLLLYERARSKG